VLGGAVIARRRSAHANADARRQVEKQTQLAQQNTAEHIEHFRKAFIAETNLLVTF